MRLMKYGVLAGLLIALVIAAAVRAPFVQDRLFKRALAEAMKIGDQDLFDGDGLKVFFCGTSSPIVSVNRAQACTAVIAGDHFFLVDVGTGSWEVVQANGIPAERLAGIFLTHFHSDHIGDLGEANLGSWVLGRNKPLDIYGPEGVEEIVDGLNATFSLDNEYRTAHHGKAIAPIRSEGLKANPFQALPSSTVYDEGGLRVTAFLVEHEPADPAVGYRFDYKDRSVVISGDTAYSENLVANSKDSDLLIHEAQANELVKEMQAAAAKAGRANLAKILSDIPSYHTSPVEAAKAANEAGAEWLILTHLTPPPDNRVTERMFMRGVKKVRPRNVKFAEDGMFVVLPDSGGVKFQNP